MKTEEGFKFTFDVTNVRGMTYVHGSAWKELARVYGFHVGQKLIFNIDKEGPRVRLTIGNWPRLHQVISCSTLARLSKCPRLFALKLCTLLL